jgi:hypothetical protein
LLQIAPADAASINRLVEISKESMTSDRVAEIHAEAQKNYVKEKLRKSISVALKLFVKERPMIMSANPKVKSNNLATDVIQGVAKEFRFQGYDPYSSAAIIQNLLWPPSQGTSTFEAVVGHGLVGAMGVAAKAVAAKIPIVGAAATAATTAATAALLAYNLSINMIRVCLDVILVLERVFWYDGLTINATYIRAACLYYIRLRPRVYERLASKFNANFPNPMNYLTEFAVGSAFNEIVEEFGYKKLGQ